MIKFENTEVLGWEHAIRSIPAKGYRQTKNGRYEAFVSDHSKSIFLGTYDTPEEAKKVVVKEKQLLIDYLNDSIHLANDYLENVDEASFSEVIDTNWTPPVTRGD